MSARLPSSWWAAAVNSYYHDRADGRWSSYVLHEAIPQAGAFDDAPDFERHDVLAAARENPRLYGRTRVWIDVGDRDSFRTAAAELARSLAGAELRIRRGDHSLAYNRRNFRDYLRFYADALAEC